MKLCYFKICISGNCVSMEILVLSVTRLHVAVNIAQSACSFAERHSEMISTPMFGVLGSNIS
jgi:hypothetical protein